MGLLPRRMKWPAVSPSVRRKILLPAGLVLLTFAVLLLPERFQALWPPLLALVVVFSTRLAAWGLFLGGAAGCLLLAAGNPLRAAGAWWAEHLGPAFLGSWTVADGIRALPAQWHQWHLGAVVFTLLLGAFAALLATSTPLW